MIVGLGVTGVVSEAAADRRGGGKEKPRGMFEQLRADDGALERARRFLNAAGHGFGDVAAPLIVAADDASMLGQLRAAWRAHHGETPRETEHSRAARAEKRVTEAFEYFGPERCKSQVPGYRYLDVGAAEGDITGAVAAALRLTPEQAVAVDILPGRSAAAYTSVQIDGETLPFPDRSFDLISMFMSAHHFEHVTAMFAEAGRVAKPGARLVMREHGRADPSTALYYDFIHAFYAVVQADETTPERFAAAYARGRYAQYRTPDEWRRVAAAAGFRRIAHTAPKPDSFDTVRALYIYIKPADSATAATSPEVAADEKSEGALAWRRATRTRPQRSRETR
jgi:ubiquinone/menaquinone biosynthesis C-methylase UbiE